MPALNLSLEGEVVALLADGWSLRSSSKAWLSGDYIRLCRPDGSEHTYWDCSEWRDEPELVMGAIINLAAGLKR